MSLPHPDKAAELTAILEDSWLAEIDLVAFCDHTVEGLIAIHGEEVAETTIHACINHHDAMGAAELAAMRDV